MYKFKTKPYDHQQVALDKSWKRRNFALLMEMGTGKTKVAIDSMGMLFQEKEIEDSIKNMVKNVQSYVPGYRLKQEVQFERFGSNNPCRIPGIGEYEGIKTSIFLEVEGAGHYLPKYAGNLDIMTSAALGTAESLVRKKYN